MPLDKQGMRVRVFRLLDDNDPDTGAIPDGADANDGTRWTVSEVDDAIEVALDEVVMEYVRRGGDLLDDVLELTTDANSELDMSSYNPISVRSVSIKTNGIYYPIESSRVTDREVNATGVKTLLVRFTRRPALPATAATDFTFGSAGNGWPALHQLIAVRAALNLMPKDAELNSALNERNNSLSDTVMKSGAVPQHHGFPRHRSGWFEWESKIHRYNFENNANGGQRLKVTRLSLV